MRKRAEDLLVARIVGDLLRAAAEGESDYERERERFRGRAARWAR